MDYRFLESKKIHGFLDLGDRIAVFASLTERLVVEKSALVPAECSNPRWEQAFITPCRCIEVPAEPNNLNFGWHTVLMLVDVNCAAWRVDWDCKQSPKLGAKLRDIRKQSRLSIGRVARLSGISREKISAMEAGLPVYPYTTFWRVVLAIYNHNHPTAQPVNPAGR